MNTSWLVTMKLSPGPRAAFDRYEEHVLTIMRSHGGDVTKNQTLEGDPRWDVLHEITFPSQAAFEAFLEDPARVALQAQRDACIQDTEVTKLS